MQATINIRPVAKPFAMIIALVMKFVLCPSSFPAVSALAPLSSRFYYRVRVSIPQLSIERLGKWLSKNEVMDCLGLTWVRIQRGGVVHL